MLAQAAVQAANVEPAQGLRELEDVEPLHGEPQHHESDSIRTVKGTEVSPEALPARALDIALLKPPLERAGDLLPDLVREFLRLVRLAADQGEAELGLGRVGRRERVVDQPLAVPLR